MTRDSRGLAPELAPRRDRRGNSRSPLWLKFRYSREGCLGVVGDMPGQWANSSEAGAVALASARLAEPCPFTVATKPEPSRSVSAIVEILDFEIHHPKPVDGGRASPTWSSMQTLPCRQRLAGDAVLRHMYRDIREGLPGVEL